MTGIDTVKRGKETKKLITEIHIITRECVKCGYVDVHDYNDDDGIQNCYRIEDGETFFDDFNSCWAYDDSCPSTRFKLLSHTITQVRIPKGMEMVKTSPINLSNEQVKWLIVELHDKLTNHNKPELEKMDFIFANNILVKIVKIYNKNTNKYFNWQLHDPAYPPSYENILEEWL